MCFKRKVNRAFDRVVAFLPRFEEAAESRKAQREVYKDWNNLYRDRLCKLKTRRLAVLIAKLMDEGIDADTHMGFVVGSGGRLTTADSLRVFFLDHVFQIDRQLALRLSRDVLAKQVNQSESALALRNLAWLGEEGVTQGEIDHAFSLVITKKEWQQEPKSGYCCSLDIAVGRASTGTIGTLVDLLHELPSVVNAGAKAALQQASSLALDRVMQTNPELVLDEFVKAPNTFLATTPGIRCSMMSRVNVTTSQGRTALVVYLNDVDHQGMELYGFLRGFPTGNFFTGYRLVSKSEHATKHNIYRIYKKSYEVVVELRNNGEITKEHADHLLHNFGAYFPGGPPQTVGE